MTQPNETHIVILGAGFGGVYTALHLERALKKQCGTEPPSVRITLVNRDNYFLMTPLLFEASSGVLEPRHSVNPIRPLLGKTRFVEAEVEAVDVNAGTITARHEPGFPTFEIHFDQLVIALGGVTNRAIIPGSEDALLFKTLGDGIFLRNHVIDLFERAEVEKDQEPRRALLRFIIVGAGLVGVELMGELTEFVKALRRSYPRLDPDPVEFYLIEAGPKVLPELERDLADHAVEALKRRGVDVRTDTPVKGISGNRISLPDGKQIQAGTIILATGVAPNPLLAKIDVEKDRKGRIATEPTMRVKGRENIWAIGDCASIPDPQGKPYPSLAQHAIREARVLAKNIAQVVTHGGAAHLEPFVYKSLGTLAALGHFDGVGRVLKLKLRGFAAWWVWRSYYLFQMPRWERRFRIMLDWTVALLFRTDVVKLDLFGQEHPLRRRGAQEAGQDVQPGHRAS